MRHVLLLFLSLANFTVIAQEKVDTLAKDNLSIPLPSVHINFGFNYGFTDVALSNGVNPAKQIGYQLTINQRVTKYLDASFEIYTGSVYGEEQRDLTNINYRSSLFSTRLGLEYNFFPLLKPDARGRQLLRPYVGFGLGILYFRTKGDLKDNAGRTYHYWTDGGIYAEPQGTVDQSEATAIERDFEYETELRDANLDNLGRYSQTAFTLPINAGIRFQLSKNVGLNLAFAYAFNFTDLIDNVSSESLGAREGGSGFDNNLFGSIGLSLYLGRTKPSAKPTKPRFEELSVETGSKPVDKIEKVSNRNEAERWNELEAISEQLIDASTSMREISKNSERAIEQSSQDLSAIAKRTIDSKKELNAVKNESIELLENSILTLQKTSTDINIASNKVEAVSTDLSSKKIENEFSGAQKIKATVEETIPAMELLKIRIARAKTEEELRSILNISAKNLSHTQSIFSEESSDINESLVKVRKNIVEARTIQILSGTVSSMQEINSVREELTALLKEGVISEIRFVELSENLDKSETELVSIESEAGKRSELQNTSLLLKNVLAYFSETGSVTGESLSERRNELNSIAGQSLKSKKALNSAKEEALRVLEQALIDLQTANETVVITQLDLSKVGSDISELDKEEMTRESEAINSSLETTMALIEDSKSKIKSSKNSEELKSVINYASAKLIETKETVASRSEVAAAKVDKARKDLIVSEVAIANRNAIPAKNTEPAKIPAEGSEKLSGQLEKLLTDGLIQEEEYRLMKGAVELATDSEVRATDGGSSQKSSETVSSSTPDISETPEKDSVKPDNQKPRKGFDRETIADSEPKQSGRFSWADLNKDNWISPNEVLHFIDLLFEGEAVRTVEDIQELIDYYFDQE